MVQPSLQPTESHSDVSATTLVDRVRHHASERPDQLAFRYLIDGETPGPELTFRALDRRARAVAARLQDLEATSERALLLYPAGLEFVVAFLGCLYAGTVAVPAYPPRPRRTDPRLRAIADDARPRFVLASPGLAERREELAETVSGLARTRAQSRVGTRWLATESIDPDAADRYAGPGPRPSDPAFLQYTSGSTARPKGVVVDHANLMHNERMIRDAFGQTEESVIVGWLPLYHDMGLIGNVLQPLFVGAHCVLMAPTAFLQRPVRWLEAIDRYRATTSGGPNFAYELCARRVSEEERERLDLSSWRVAFNGAEPVRAATLERFAETFGPSGFRREAFFPCYGLAEATLFVTGGQPGRGPVLRDVDSDALADHRAESPADGAAVRTLVGCGRSRADQTVAVVDPETGRRLPEARVGEIWVAGPSVARGYRERPEETAETFGARLADATGHDEAPFLRTGDLGFLADGELFVTGRLKDLIIVRGRNLYPQDVEATVQESHPGLRADSGAAFSVEIDGEERLVVVQEVERTWRHDVDDLPPRVARAVTEEHQVPVEAVVLVRPGRVPKTTSGKIRRNACRRRYLDGDVRPLALWYRGEAGAAGEDDPGREAATPTERRLQALWREVLEVDRVGVDEDLFALGGDSLTATRLAARVQDSFGVELSLETLFDHPTVARLAAVLDRVEGPGAAGDAPPLEQRSGADREATPLSYAQRRLWFLHQLEPSNPVHNIAATVDLDGRLDAPALAGALRAVLHRHEALRTRFLEGDDEPVQRPVDRTGKDPLPVVDLAALPRPSRSVAAGELARALARRPFRLDAGRFLRTVLFRRTRQDHALVVVMHHIASDGGSLEVFLREVAELYEARRLGREPSLPALPVQYADFARWQRRWLRGEALDGRMAYWRERLAGELPALDLPADRPRPPVLSHRGAHLERRLPPRLAAGLEELARSAGATPFMALLTGFLVLLHRLTGQDDLLVGSPISGRLRREVEDLIGVFINNLVLRTSAEGDPTFRELLDRVRETTVGAYSHQEVPFEALVEELVPERDLSRTPLFQVMFVGQNAPLEPVELPELTLAPHEIDAGTARFDLSLSMAPVGEGWLGTWKYSTDLFDGTTIERMAGHLETLVGSALAAPDAPLSGLSTLTPAQSHQILAAWNDTHGEYRPGATLPALVAEQARRTPDAVAVIDDGRALTYDGLRRRATALAGRLAALGVRPESRVGVLAERSLELMVGLLGVLEAGAAYVPLDPGHPRERLAFLLDDAGVAAVLVQAGLARTLPDTADGDAPRVELTASLPGPQDGPSVDPETGGSLPGPEAAAYAIYTSGSTGRPKGVVVSHRAIVNRLLWMQETYGLGGDDRVLQKTPTSFDVSVWELFWPLITGAGLVLAPPGAQRDGVRLLELVAEHRVTTLHFVPSMLPIFLDERDVAPRCRSLCRVISSGEALPPELAERFGEQSDAALDNLYGPTEAAVDVTRHPWTGTERLTIPIGRPIANLRLHVVDRTLRPVPVGVPGELCIAGVGLARGYLGRPGRTAESFLPDPFGPRLEGGAPGDRLYRTGDLARYRPDGEIEFLGRLDHQVKVRGFRIEPGEIAAVLHEHPDVREAVVVARVASGARHLVAYVVGAEGREPTTAALREHAARSLPEHMVPSTFVPLEELPLTRSGKVDRKALPAPESPHPADAESFVPPRTDLERRLAALWQEVLEIDRVGLDDNFFELGGDSIQGAMLVNRLQRELDEVVYVMALFDAPTVRRLAALLEETYPEAVGRLGGEGAASPSVVPAAPEHELGADAVAELEAAWTRRLGRSPDRDPARSAAGPIGADERANPPAVFILSPFRSGSTLLRVMLAGHSRLFAPPELELLAFRRMDERRRAYSGRDRFAREGLVRAVMELEGCGADRAWELLGEHEDEGAPTGRVYRWLQERAGDRLLVDKTPSYSLDAAALSRAEELFREPLYVHLVRHPWATVDSYVEARMDRVYRELPYAAHEQAELVWRLGHANIVDFLSRVPRGRWARVRFEDLVRSPDETMDRLCRFLGVELEPDVLDPYQGERMTDGLREGGRMMGDPKFHEHRRIDAGVAERWRARDDGRSLAPATRRLAGALGYPEVGPSAAEPASDVAEPAPAPEPGAASGRSPDEPPPLSFSQERLWFLTELEPASAAYNMPAAVRLEGELDPGALARSFAAVLRRHEVLRTGFPAVDGRPVPEVLPPRTVDSPVDLPVVDLERLVGSGEAVEREVRSIARTEGARPFDLARPPMLRTALLRRGPRDHVLLVTMHHIASDGWSIGVLIHELAALYRAFVRGRPSPLPPLPLQYADYAAWQRTWLDGRRMGEHLEYWRERLAGRLPPLELPADRPRPPVQTFHGARRSRRLSPAETERVKAWGRRQGTTPFLILLAAFDALLARITGQDDLLLGIPIANRNRVEIEDLIGFFLNMVVQRADASGDPPFRELLDRVSDGFLESTPHQEVPFEKVVEAVQPERDLSRSPIFQIQFSLQNTPMEPLRLPGLRLELLEIHNRTTKFDLTVFLFDEPEGLLTTLEYNTDLFDGTTMERFLRHWQTVLLGAVEAPDRRVTELPLLTAPERAQLRTEWNDPRAAFDDAPALHRLFEEQAESRPDHPAVVFELDELSYRDLDRRANALAHRLVHAGVGPEVPVGLCVERSVETVVGILGILKAGGAYVPLDPAYPEERLDYILEDALAGVEPAVVVTQSPLVPLLESLEGAGHRRLVTLDGPEAETPEESPPAVEIRPEHRAYVIYTSGSTGRPKGVEVPHGNAVRLLRATDAWFGFGPEDVWTLFHSYAFDFSVWELWGALAYGGSLVVVPDAVTRSPSAFYELLETEGVTVLNQTPSAFRQLLGVEEQEGARDLELRWVVFGGEALDLPALRPWVERHGDERPGLVNMYGITETTVHVTYRRVRAADLDRPGPSTVGVPIPDLRVHLLGPRLEPVPVGVPGEIHVAGAGLARGYLDRPGLTAERFVPDPLAPDLSTSDSGASGGRLYKSGDLARWRPDGDLEYLGRIDHQVKIRGFRIELGEIESALADLPEVADAVVAARAAEGSDERRLVAYVVPRGAQPATDGLRRHLRELLPEYMVPSVFVPLDQLPTTPSGKVDRKSLPEPDEARPELETGYVAPHTRAERRLAEIWSEVLPVDRVGVDDDFFDLGGHSLLATQLVSRLRAAFGIDLPMAAVFERSTVAGLAERIEELVPEDEGELPDGSEGDAAQGPPIEPVAGELDEIPLSYTQERLWFVEQLERGVSLYSLPMALRLEGPLDAAAFAASIHEVVARHDALRTAFPSRSGRPVQAVDPDWRPPVPVVDLGGLPAGRARAETGRLVVAERRRPFDLERVGLLRTTLVRRGPEDHHLLITMHHLVSDGWSMGVFVREAASAYEAFVRGEPTPLEPLPVQYPDFAVWQRRWLDGEVLEAEIDHWRERLAGAAPVELPADRRAEPGQVFAAGDLVMRVPEPVVERLEALGQRHEASLFMTLLAVFQVLLARHAGQDDVVVGSPVANRNRKEIEGLIGFFVNTLVLRSDASGDPSFRDFLERVRDVTMDAFEHQDMPFSKLVEALRPERRGGTTPFLEAMFTLHNQPMPELRLGEVTLHPPARSDRDDVRTSFALSLRFWPDADGLVGGFAYNAGLFDRTTAERWRRQFLGLLETVTEAPDRPLAELPLLPASERHQVLVEWPHWHEGPEAPRVVDGADRPVPIGIWGTLRGGAERIGPGERARFRADATLERPESGGASAETGRSAEEGAPSDRSDQPEPTAEPVRDRRAELSRRRRGLSDAKRKLLERRLRAGRAGRPERSARSEVSPGPRSDRRAAPSTSNGGRRSAAGSPLVTIRPDGRSGRAPLFCVHAVGGTVFCYRELARALADVGEERPVYGLQAPGLHGEREPHGEVEVMAEEYLESIRAAHPDGPYLLAGWSFGGVIAYEIGRRLREAGEPVDLLALIDSRLPGPEDRLPDGDELDLLLSFLRDLEAQKDRRGPNRLQGGSGDGFRDELRSLDSEGRLRAVLDRAKEAGLVAPEIELRQIRGLLDVYRANLRALYRYRPPAYPGQVTLFRPEEAPPDEAAGSVDWLRRAERGVAVEEVPGDHYSVLGRPQVEDLSERLRTALRSATENRSTEGVSG